MKAKYTFVGWSGLLLFSGMLICLLGSCSSQEENDKPIPGDATQVPVESMPPACGNPMSLTLLDKERAVYGRCEVLNNKEFVWVTFLPAPGIQVIQASIYMGSEGELPLLSPGNPDFNQFPHQIQGTGQSPLIQFKLPLASFAKCNTVSIHARIKTQENEVLIWAKDRALGPEPIYEYCLQSCKEAKPACEMKPGAFKTLTQEGWVSDDHWSYAEEHFSKAFPEGMEVGCNQKLNFNQSEALKKFLPNKGKESELTTDFTNPSQTDFSSELAGELCAVMLSLGFDKVDPDFSLSAYPLADLVVSKGPFDGWAVHEVANEAHQMIGACASSYNPLQLAEVLRQINAEFVKGGEPKGFLTCKTDQP